MNVKGLEYILVETTDLSKWEDYGTNVCGFMKNLLLSNDNQIAFKIDKEPFRFLITKGPANRYIAGGFALEDASAMNLAKQELTNQGVENLRKVKLKLERFVKVLGFKILQVTH